MPNSALGAGDPGWEAAAGDDRRAGARGHLLVGIAAAIVAAAETALLVALWRDALALGPTFAIHGAIVALLAGAAAAHYRRTRRGDPALILLSFATAFLGPVGAAGSLLTAALYLASYRTATLFSEWYRALFPEDEELAGRALDERLVALDARGVDRGGVTPFMAVLSYGTRQQQQQAITLMTRKFHPAFAPALRQALRHPDNAVRVQAATAVATIEDEFLRQANALEDAAGKDAGNPKGLLAMAVHYDNYSHTGLLDAQREQRSRNSALKAYLDYLRTVPQDVVVRLAIGRLLLRSGRFDQTGEWFAQCIKEGQWSAQMIPWYMESLYRLGRLEEVRRLAKDHYQELTRLDEFPMKVVDTVHLWATAESGAGPLRPAAT